MPRLSEAISDDHRRLEQEYHALRSASSDGEGAALRDTFAFDLARHCITEDQVLLPILEISLPDGRQRREQMSTDHKSLKLKLEKLRLIPLEDINFVQELQALWVDLSAHIEDSEEKDLPLLETSLSVEESETLCRSFGQARMLATAGEHPHHEATTHPADSVKEFLALHGKSLEELDSVLGHRDAAP